MKHRCSNPTNHRYSDYGGRGIRVCERWEKFENFLADMGPRPNKTLSLDRIDNNGNYEPGNCRWATMKQQRENARGITLLTIGSETLCVKDWAQRLGINRSSLVYRLKNGWKPELAVTMQAISSHKRNLAKTHCPQGHPYSGDNLILYKTWRRCRTCFNAKEKRRHAKKVATYLDGIRTGYARGFAAATEHATKLAEALQR